eukprot:TRINITY_DN2428_c0_g1_i4.p1 TRINITY_DN2428_c0_g1~~TRINITY_DN2428_c0_g1_i4.p1  ORF type:complete len:637 (-),score=81.01 TRINITY_DN2428_c0_g1_i4:119-2029(-)
MSTIYLSTSNVYDEQFASQDNKKKDTEEILSNLRSDVIGGRDCIEDGPYGTVPLVYADYTASGRLLQSIENFMQRVVYPVYANTHTDASYCGAQISTLYKEARQIVCECFKVDPNEFAVLFTGSGCTGALHKLTQILRLNKKRTYSDKPVVFVGPYEHHSNEVLWRECKCDVIVIPEDSQGAIDLNVLTKKLIKYKSRTMKIGSFSAGSNVTGIVTDVEKITRILHDNGALAFFDFAGTGAYVPIDVSNKDAIFLSPHKFIGGPGSSGVLVFRRSIYQAKVPSVPAGGTVSYVTPKQHWYVEDIEAREEGGTPPILQAIRAALAIRFKQVVGEDLIEQLEKKMIDKFLQALSLQELNIFLIGSDRPVYWKHPRVSIFSFLIPYHDPMHPQQKALHHNYVAALLNDLYGIQSRSGCFCAGPYGHRLFDTIFGDVDRFSRAIQPLVVEKGLEALKWGWVRINLNYFIGNDEVDYIINAIIQISQHAWKLLPQYSVDLQTGLWKHNALQHSTITTSNVSLYDFGVSPISVKKGGQNRPSFSEALQNAQNVYDSAYEHVDDVKYDPRFSRSEVDQVRWFPIPYEGALMLKSPPLIVQSTSQKDGFWSRFKTQSFEKYYQENQRKKLSLFSFKCANPITLE